MKTTVWYYGRTFASFDELVEAVLEFGSPFANFIEAVRDTCVQRQTPVSAEAAVAYLTVMEGNGEGRFPKARDAHCAGFYFGANEAYFLGWKNEGDGWDVILGLEAPAPTECREAREERMQETGWQRILCEQPVPA